MRLLLIVAPWLPQSRYFLQQCIKIADMWIFHCLAWLSPRKATPRILARFRDFERTEHARRTPPGIQTCAVVCRRPLYVPRSLEREKRPMGAGEKRANVNEKTHWYIAIIYRRPAFWGTSNGLFWRGYRVSSTA